MEVFVSSHGHFGWFVCVLLLARFSYVPFLPPLLRGTRVAPQSTTPSKAKSESKSPITNFFPPKASEAADANGGGGSSASSKKRKAPASPKSPGPSSGFVAFCRANRTRVSQSVLHGRLFFVVGWLAYV